MARLADIDIAPDVLASALAGNECAQAAIYAAVAPAAFGLIRRLAGSRALAEDLFQETMMALFQSLSAFRGEAPLGAWVRRIAVSKCLMYLRSPWHRARVSLRSDANSDSDANPGSGISTGSGVGPGPWSVGRRATDAAMPATPAPRPECLDVERALASLTPTARAVVWLYEVEGYSHEEIAQSFGRSVSFSKSQLARAHSKLRQWFDPLVDGETCTTP